MKPIESGGKDCAVALSGTSVFDSPFHEDLAFGKLTWLLAPNQTLELSGSYDELLRSTTTFVNDELAAIYGHHH